MEISLAIFQGFQHRVRPLADFVQIPTNNWEPLVSTGWRSIFYLPLCFSPDPSRARARVCVCVCVCERERERESGRETARAFAGMA